MKNYLTLSILLCSILYSEVFELGVVEVKANNQNTPGVSQISSEEMRINNALNVGEISKMILGVSLMGASGSRNESMINIRGFKSTRVPIYIDGVPAYVVYDGNMDLGRFTTSDLAQIDISKGANSVLYGPNSLGGVINLISYKPQKEMEIDLHWGAKYGNTKGENRKKLFNNQLDARFGTRQENFWFQITGAFNKNYNSPLSNKVKSPIDTSYSNESRDKKISLKLGLIPNENHEYVIGYSKQEGEKTGKIYMGHNADNIGRDRYWYWPHWDKESWFLHGNSEFDTWYIKSKFYYDKFINELQNMDNHKYNTLNQKNKGGGGFVSNYNDYSFGGSLEFGIDINQKKSS